MGMLGMWRSQDPSKMVSDQNDEEARVPGGTASRPTRTVTSAASPLTAPALPTKAPCRPVTPESTG